MLFTDLLFLAAYACTLGYTFAVPAVFANTSTTDIADLAARRIIGPSQHGYIPFVHPARCHTNNIYCLTVSTGRGDPLPFRDAYGKISWIEGEVGDNWRTAAFNGQFRGTLPVNCGPTGYQDVDIWLGMVKGWSNMSTRAPFIEGKTSDGKMMLPGVHGAAVGSGMPWVDFAVWCVDA